MLTDWNFWFSIITAVVAIIALVQTKQQIKLSNKQYLFDKRVEYYLIAKGLIQLYESNQNSLVSQDDRPMLAMDIRFSLMTNNTYLEKIADVIKHPLDQPYQKEFLIKIEAIKDVSAQIKFLFNGKTALTLGNYVSCYQELLFKMYQYQILLKSMEKESQNSRLAFDKVQELVGEKDHREVLKKAIENLKQAYDMIKKEKVEEKIEKQIKLK